MWDDLFNGDVFSWRGTVVWCNAVLGRGEVVLPYPDTDHSHVLLKLCYAMGGGEDVATADNSASTRKATTLIFKRKTLYLHIFLVRSDH